LYADEFLNPLCLVRGALIDNKEDWLLGTPSSRRFKNSSHTCASTKPSRSMKPNLPWALTADKLFMEQHRLIALTTDVRPTGTHQRVPAW